MPPRPRALTADELELVQEIEADQTPKRRRLTLLAPTLRALVLGLPVQMPAGQAGEAGQAAQDRVIEIAQTGLRIQNCLIAGPLNLQDASGPEGIALPPLALENCIFTDTIEVSRARFRALSFADSRITEICGNNLRLEGPLDISKIRSSEAMEEAAPFRLNPTLRTGCVYRKKQFGRAWVELKNAQIEGDITASKACLVAPRFRPNYSRSNEIPRFALALQNSDVRGNLGLDQAFALGGVSAARAKIAGHILASGVHVAGMEGPAFNLEGATVSGGVFLGCWSSQSSRTRRFEARGEVTLSGTRVQGQFTMQGASLKASGANAALVADRAQFGGHCFFSGFELPEALRKGKPAPFYRFHAEGGLNLAYSSFQGDIYLLGVLLKPDASGTALNATGITVSGNMMFSPQAVQTAVGQHTYPSVSTGLLLLNYAELQQDLDMDGAKLYIESAFRTQAALSATGMRVKGLCRLAATSGFRHGKPRLLRFWSSSLVSLVTAEIGDSLFMQGASVREGTGSTDGIALDLYGTRIGQDATLSLATFALGPREYSLRFVSHGCLNLPYLTIGNALRMQGVRVTQTRGRAAIDCDYIHVGSFINLGAYSGERMECEGTVILSHAQIGTNLTLAFADIRTKNQTAPPLAIANSKIGGDLNLRGTTLTGDFIRNNVILNLSDSLVTGELEVDLSVLRTASSFPPAQTRPFDIDMREFHIHQLKDGKGYGWGRDSRLLLDGFVCDRLPPRLVEIKPIQILPDFVYSKLPGPLRTPFELVSRWVFGVILPIVLVFSLPVVLILTMCTPITGSNPAGRARRGMRRGWELLGQLVSALLSLNHAAELHLAWLNRHYSDPKHPRQDEFTPSAYDRLANLLQEEGYEQESKKVLSAKLDVKRKVSAPWYALIFWFIYKGLGYGLSPFNAFATMFVLLMFGWGAVWVADRDMNWPIAHKHVLVVTTSTVNTLAVEDPNGEKQLTTAVAYGGSTKPVTEEIPCGKRIDPPLYAMEVFIPALDLHQTSLCEVSYETEARGWRIGRAVYAILGWIVTSIAVLTVPGILRKRAEE